ncbi:hypothetical protein V1639_11780 [Pseudarthrobacter sp. J75]|uniref:hypothetical protein n=1 Tax=unclassified Pseudarthrobacter TaxID=2647000 RepID=UPI002E814CDF|nr:MULTISPECIES: hypothetical protein [unclassified Pseudarthrobacter]MEE2523016.1 hypothetical protein [Pseudarthrobacter sp. J47]MEE2529699.1 hypothetical protein [Pseudarthrobacter sp. J75]
MEPVLDFLGSFWWLIFPLSGVVGGWAKAWSKASERRHERKVQLYQLKHQAQQQDRATATEIEALISSHDAVNRRWLDYELDVGKLIDFPMMTDVREPLTVAFLRAKRDADGLRPEDPEAARADRGAVNRYREAVRHYETAFDVAEREARRIKDSNFTELERQRLATARKLLRLAGDGAATPAERRAAYQRARRELDGLLELPDAAIAAIEQRVAGRLEPGRPDPGNRAAGNARDPAT